MENVILVCEGLTNRAGIERMTVELANLLSQDYIVSIVVIDSFRKEICPFTINNNVNVISLYSSFKKSIRNLNIRLIKQLRNFFKEKRPRTVITVATPLVRLTAPACIGLGIKNIAWEHFNIYAGSRMGTIFKIIAPWFVNKTVVLTKQDERDYNSKYAPNVITIPNFTTIGQNEPSHCNDKILLAVGRHAHQKGFDMLIKAWAKTDIQDWTLRIVGSGADKPQNEELAHNLGLDDRIEFKESTPDIVSEFQNASCFILSSRFEGLVLVLIEAKMMGLPCISFDCPNSPAEIIHNGVDGILVPPEDIDALAKAITSTLKNMSHLKQMGIMARKDAMNRYSAEAIKSKWNNIL